MAANHSHVQFVNSPTLVNSSNIFEVSTDPDTRYVELLAAVMTNPCNIQHPINRAILFIINLFVIVGMGDIKLTYPKMISPV